MARQWRGERNKRQESENKKRTENMRYSQEKKNLKGEQIKMDEGH